MDLDMKIPNSVTDVFDKYFVSKRAAQRAADAVQHLCPYKIHAHYGELLGWLVRLDRPLAMNPNFVGLDMMSLYTETKN